MKKILSVFLTAFILLSIFSFTASAKEIKGGKLSVDTVSAKTGQEIEVPIHITENPGIMAITLSITYESSKLEFVSLTKGEVFSSPTYQAHSSKNIIRYVICDAADNTKNGIMTTLKFKVKSNAYYGLSPISFKYDSGDFSNSKYDKILPESTAGGVEIAFNGKNCPHTGKYGEWEIIKKATCETDGQRKRICTKCQYTQNQTIEALGHEYSDKWTVDTPATPTSKGSMSRHCIRCDSCVDIVSFDYEDVKKEDINNETGKTVDKQTGNELFKEQYPDKELTPTNPPVKKTEKSNGGTVSSDGKASSGLKTEDKDSSKTEESDKKETTSIITKEQTEKINKVIESDLPIIKKLKSFFSIIIISFAILFIL